MTDRIAIVIGTKAELIKCMPVMLELQNQNKEYWFIHTGQHPVADACKEFGVKQPDYILSEEPKKSTKFWSKINSNSISWCFKMVYKIRKLIKELKPKYIIYHGDTMSTAVAAMASSKILNPGKNWENVHLEAGLRSGTLKEPFPEEISRQISDRFSDILLAVSDLTENNLNKQFKGKKKVFKVGNTILDSSRMTYNKAKMKFKEQYEEYVLINIHRHEHLNNKENLTKIVEIINSIETRGIWPLHDNTRKFLEKYDLFDKINTDKIEITALKSYEEFIFLLAHAKYLIADGGSIQEESLVFNKLCLILRNVTERQEGLEVGINFLTMDVKKAKEIIYMMERGIDIPEFENPYGEEGVSKRIVELLA